MFLLVWVISLDLSGKEDPASGYATACIALGIIWPLKPHQCIKVGVPWVGTNKNYLSQNSRVLHVEAFYNVNHMMLIMVVVVV